MSILGLTFNQSNMNVICCTEQGYIIYKLHPDLEKIIYSDLNGGVNFMKNFQKSNISIVNGGGDKPFKSKDVLILYDQLKKTNLIEIDMKEQIKNAFIIKDRIITVLEKKVCIFDWQGILIESKLSYSNEKG